MVSLAHQILRIRDLERIYSSSSPSILANGYDNPSKALTLLCQNTTVFAYQESFERLLQKVDSLQEKFLGLLGMRPS